MGLNLRENCGFCDKFRNKTPDIFKILKKVDQAYLKLFLNAV